MVCTYKLDVVRGWNKDNLLLNLVGKDHDSVIISKTINNVSYSSWTANRVYT